MVTTFLSGLLIAAHFLRAGIIPLASLGIMFPFLLTIRSRWATVLAQLALATAAVVWLITIHSIAMQRLSEGLPWMRMTFILGTVVLITVASVFLIHEPSTTE